MTKEEILALSATVMSLKLPRLATERRLAWLQLATALSAKATDIWAERDAIAAIDEIDDTEREKMWRVALGQQSAADGEGFVVAQDEILEICQVNEHLTIGAQQLLIQTLTKNEAQ